MSYASQSSRYLENEILSRPKEWLVPLLFEHLMSSLTRAGVQIETGDIEGKAKSLEKASAILFELLGSLDHEQGGEIARNLASLYSFLAGEILKVGVTLDLKLLQRVLGMVTELHEAWVQAAEQVAPRARPAGASLASVA
jgi:flagellar secretion chaperone FliS